MARYRTIKPEFYGNTEVCECSLPARLMFIGMWNFCDDNGVMPASPKGLRIKVFPGENSISDTLVALWVTELIRQKLVWEFYVPDHDEWYWYITGLTTNQRIDKPSCKYPKPEEASNDSADCPSQRDQLVLTARLRCQQASASKNHDDAGLTTVVTGDSASQACAGNNSTQPSDSASAACAGNLDPSDALQLIGVDIQELTTLFVVNPNTVLNVGLENSNTALSDVLDRSKDTIPIKKEGKEGKGEKERTLSDDETEIFKVFWELYPKRNGGHSKGASVKAWKSRRKEHSAETILAGARRYKLWCDATETTGTQYVKQAQTFLGPNCHFLDDHEITKPNGAANGRQPQPPKQSHGDQTEEAAYAAAAFARKVAARSDSDSEPYLDGDVLHLCGEVDE